MYRCRFLYCRILDLAFDFPSTPSLQPPPEKSQMRSAGVFCLADGGHQSLAWQAFVSLFSNLWGIVSIYNNPREQIDYIPLKKMTLEVANGWLILSSTPERKGINTVTWDLRLETCCRWLWTLLVAWTHMDIDVSHSPVVVALQAMWRQRSYLLWYQAENIDMVGYV